MVRKNRTAEEIKIKHTAELFNNACFFARQGYAQVAVNSFQIGSLYVDEFKENNHPNAEHMRILRDSVKPTVFEGKFNAPHIGDI